MIDHGKTRSTVMPEPLIIDEFSVWVNTDITPVTETNDEMQFDGFEYDMTQYDKNEYIQIMAAQNIETNALLNVILGVN
jgi:hypothetical protein